MADNSVWAPATDCLFTHNAFVFDTQDVEFTEEHEEFETTNSKSSGYREFGTGVRNFRIRGTVHRDTVNGQKPVTRTRLGATFTDGEDVYTGFAILTNLATAGGGRGGTRYNFSGGFTGTVTKS